MIISKVIIIILILFFKIINNVLDISSKQNKQNIITLMGLFFRILIVFEVKIRLKSVVIPQKGQFFLVSDLYAHDVFIGVYFFMYGLVRGRLKAYNISSIKVKLIQKYFFLILCTNISPYYANNYM